MNHALEYSEQLVFKLDPKTSIFRYNPNQKTGNLCANTSKKSEKSINRTNTNEDSPNKYRQGDKENNRSNEANVNSTKMDNEWSDINEVIESDFLISPGDIYPNCKVELQDATITDETKENFEDICKKYEEAFSKNNKDIGRMQLIEMEIDMGNSIPLAQSPYTLPLKHYDWLRNEIETLEKAGVIERSLLPWASPVIVVPKKSAPDEPPVDGCVWIIKRLMRYNRKLREQTKDWLFIIVSSAEN